MGRSLRALRADDPVITPTGRRAVIRAITAEGFCQITYLDKPGEPGEVHERLLRRLRRGLADPDPVRIDANDQVL